MVNWCSQVHYIYGDVPDEVNIKDEVAVGNDDERIWVSLFSLLSILLEAILDSPHYWLSHSRDKGSLVSVFRLITSIMMTIWIYPCMVRDFSPHY